VHVVDRGERRQPFARWARKCAERHAVELVVPVGLEAVVSVSVGAVEDDGLVVGDGGDLENGSFYRHGRCRPDTSVSGPHHRPDHRHGLGSDEAGAATTGLGQTNSTAATMAAISSELGSEGDIAMLPLGKLLAL
jgi:hypothetical protein